MKRKILSLALALAICLSLTVPALADFKPTEDEAKTYFSLTRNGEDELADKFLTGKKVTLINELTDPAESWEDYYRVISANDSWKVTHTGGKNCTIWVSLNTYILDDEGNGQYSLDGHDAWRVNESSGRGCFCDTAMVDGEGGFYVVNLAPGESISFSTEDLLAKGWSSGEITDHGDGNYVYELGVNMSFSGTGEDDTSWASYSIYLMLDEDAVKDIENDSKPTKPTTPENPDTVTPIITATPTVVETGTSTIVVTLELEYQTWFVMNRVLNVRDFSVDAGTTGLTLSNIRVTGGAAAVRGVAELTFSAENGTQPGELKITALSSAFWASNSQVFTDSNTVTITINGSSNPPPVIPDIPYVPTTPAGNSSTTTKSSTSTTTTPTTGTVTNPDGSTTTTMPDGTVTTTATDAAGNKTETVESPDGTTVTTIENKDGGTSTTTVSASGQVTAAVTVPAAAVAAAQASSQAVALPMPEVPLTANTAAAPVVTVTTGSSQPVKVEIPVERTTPGTVAVIVKTDGTEEVVKTSLTTASGVTVTVADGATVKIVDNSKSFTDTAIHWAASAITFATAHELFNGTGAGSFTPDGTMTRGMMVTVLARYDGVDTTTGATWYEKGVDWAAANNISSGADLDAPVSREQLATMLYRYAVASGLNTAASGSLNGFADAGSVSNYAADAMAWAVGAGLIGGTDKGELNPGGSATRAEVATILMRFCENVVK
ncbi:MAG: S-layer homology domain-containing protein [Oscillibacter sp.]|nr:S-layer homology domain-containing protein [Oscillibacter sp.]